MWSAETSVQILSRRQRDQKTKQSCRQDRVCFVLTCGGKVKEPWFFSRRTVHVQLSIKSTHTIAICYFFYWNKIIKKIIKGSQHLQAFFNKSVKCLCRSSTLAQLKEGGREGSDYCTSCLKFSFDHSQIQKANHSQSSIFSSWEMCHPLKLGCEILIL